jgi:hypothetical protein
MPAECGGGTRFEIAWLTWESARSAVTAVILVVCHSAANGRAREPEEGLGRQSRGLAEWSGQPDCT